MSYLRYLCLFAHSGVQHILCCVFLRIVYPMFTVSMDCSFLIAPSVFSHVYVQQKLTLQKFIWDFSRCWLSCLYLLIFLFTKTLNCLVSNIFALRVPNEDYSRNASCKPNLISLFLFLKRDTLNSQLEIVFLK